MLSTFLVQCLMAHLPYHLLIAFFTPAQGGGARAGGERAHGGGRMGGRTGGRAGGAHTHGRVDMHSHVRARTHASKLSIDDCIKSLAQVTLEDS